MSIPDLVKRGWYFEAVWIESLAKFSVTSAKYSWGIRASFCAADWDLAHELARSFAETEERIVNSDDSPDTIPAPAMEGSAAE